MASSGSGPFTPLAAFPFLIPPRSIRMTDTDRSACFGSGGLPE